MIKQKTKFLILIAFLSICSGLMVFNLTKAYLSDTEKVLGSSIKIGTWVTTPTEEQTSEPPTLTPTLTPTPTLSESPTSTLTPTPTQIITPSLVINEFLPDPNTIFTNEWVEIYNAGELPINLSGWKLVDAANHEQSLTELGTLNPGYFSVYEYSGDNWLNNSGTETLYLKDSSANIIDEHIYNGSSSDRSIGRENNGSNTWKNCTTPTKGTSNNGSC